MSSSGLVPASPVSAVRFGHDTSKLPDFELTSSTVPDPSGRPPVQAVWAVRTDMVTPRSWSGVDLGNPTSHLVADERGSGTLSPARLRRTGQTTTSRVGAGTSPTGMRPVTGPSRPRTRGPAAPVQDGTLPGSSWAVR